MKTRKLLLVDPSSSFCAALSEVLGAGYELRVCHDGAQALLQLESFCPDVLVTDLTLPVVDGITLIREAAGKVSRPAMLVTTRFSSPYIENVLVQAGVDYMMFKPCDIRALAERIDDLSSQGCNVLSAGNFCPVSTNILLTLGVNAGRKGYTYLEQIIELFRRDPGRSLTKDLYPTVGRNNRAAAAAVERAIRGVIQTAWDNRDEAIWRLYFTPGRSGMVARPTNRAFIATIAQVMAQQEQRQA